MRPVLVLAAVCLLAGCGNPVIHDITGLKTRIETPRFEACVAFYRDVVGMTVLDEWDDVGDRGAILGFGQATSGEAFVEIAHSESMTGHEGISLQFRVSDLDGMARRLDGRWEFRGPETRPWGSRYLYLQDPAGVQVILYEGDL